MLVFVVLGALCWPSTVVVFGWAYTTSDRANPVKFSPSVVDIGPHVPLFTGTVAVWLSPFPRKLPNGPVPPMIPSPNSTPSTIPATANKDSRASRMGWQHPFFSSSAEAPTRLELLTPSLEFEYTLEY